MPELPEVETSRRGIAPHILGKTFKAVEVREPRLRWPVAAEIGAVLPGQTLRSVERRGKYLLLGAETGTLILHLACPVICGSRRPTSCPANTTTSISYLPTIRC